MIAQSVVYVLVHAMIFARSSLVVSLKHLNHLLAKFATTFRQFEFILIEDAVSLSI